MQVCLVLGVALLVSMFNWFWRLYVERARMCHGYQSRRVIHLHGRFVGLLHGPANM